VNKIWSNPSAIFEGSLDIIPKSEGSSLIFLCPNREGKGRHFIPTPHLRTLFEGQCRKLENQEFLQLFFALSSNALTRPAASWAYEKLMHKRLGLGGGALSIFQSTITRTMQPSTHLLPGTLDDLKQAGINNSFYWIPYSANFPGVDGVLGDTEGHVYAIQATIAREHKSPVEGIKKVWKHMLPQVRTGRTWHYVVVTDTKGKATDYVEELSSGLRLTGVPVDVDVWGCVLTP
jgi:hypothetical protein